MGKCITVLVLTALLASAICASAETPIKMEASAGFAGVCKQGAWVPVTIKITNPTNDRVTGIISTTDFFTNQPMPVSTKFDSPGPSTKVFTHYARPDQYVTRELPVKLVTDGALPGGGDLQDRINLNLVGQEAWVVAVVGPQSATLNYLTGTKMPPNSYSQSNSPSQITAGLIDPSMIPDRPVGYESVDILALSNFSPARVSTKQLTALKMWIASGGTVVVNGGADYQALQNEWFADVLPAEVTGPAAFSGLGALSSRYGSPLAVGSVAALTLAPKKNSEVLLSQDGRPLIVRGHCGLGCVYVLAFDYAAPSLRGWDGQAEMWKDLINSSIAQTPRASSGLQVVRDYYDGYDDRSSRGTFSALATDMPSVTTPSIGVMAIFILAYLLFLVPVNYFVLHRMKRRELGWVTTPAIILVFTIGAYGMGYTMKGGKLVFRNITVVETTANERFASAITYSGLFSPARRSYNVAVSDPYAVVWDADSNINYEDYYDSSQRENRRRAAKTVLDETTTIPSLKMDMWSMKTFELTSGCDMGGPITSRLTVDWQTRRITGTVTNNTDYDLDHCIVVFAGLKANVGKISRKSAGTLRAPSVSRKPQEDSPHLSVDKQLLNAAGTSIGMTYCPVLIATSLRGPVRMALDRGEDTQSQATAFICWLDEPQVVNTGSIAAKSVTETFEMIPRDGIEDEPGIRRNQARTYDADLSITSADLHKLVVTNSGLIEDYCSHTTSPIKSLDITGDVGIGGNSLKFQCWRVDSRQWETVGSPKKNSGNFRVKIANPEQFLQGGKMRIKAIADGNDVNLLSAQVSLTKGGGAK